MFKIKTYNNIASSGLERFDTNQYDIADNHTDPDALILRSYDLHLETIPSQLKAVARAGAGVNNIPIDNYTAKGIPVFNTPGANANAVKELVLAGMLLASRNICQAWDHTKVLTAENDNLNSRVESAKKQFVGFELPGKTLTVIGLGAIGVKVANAASALGMNVVGFDPGITIQRAWELSAAVKKAHSITEAVAQADFISLHVPATEQTKHMVNTSLFNAMKPGAILVNCARGSIVDEEALLQALQSDILQCYVTDFPSGKLNEQNKVLMLPHLGASTFEAEENCAVMAADELRDYLENGNITNSVNFPEVNMPRTDSTCRLAIANANVPNMVGQISTELAAADINIIDMINKSKGDVAYTLLDINKTPSREILDKIESIKGILMVNVLS